YRAQPAAGHVSRLLGAVTDAAEYQRVGEPRDPQSQPALGLRFVFLVSEGEARDFDDIVQETNGRASQGSETRLVQYSVGFERRGHQPRQIYGPEEACPIRRQHLLAAGIARRNSLTVGEIVLGIDPVNEDYPR